jgi:hypothetical protein
VSAAEPGYVFDQVLVTRETGPASLSPGEFLALPLSERARSLLEDKVEFRRNGVPLPVIEVMRSLMSRALRGS